MIWLIKCNVTIVARSRSLDNEGQKLLATPIDSPPGKRLAITTAYHVPTKAEARAAWA